MDAVVAAIVVLTLGWLHHQNQLELERLAVSEEEKQVELDRRGVWMGGIDSDISDIKAYIDSQTVDRWTSQDDKRREAEIWKAVEAANPGFVVPAELKTWATPEKIRVFPNEQPTATPQEHRRCH